MTDFYKILEVLPNAAQEEIKRSYRRLARLYHPDGANIHTSTKTFHDIQRAYETLSDPALRRIYDKKNGFENWAQEKIDAYRKSQS
ncbi:MAG TPA: J domain-containing protein [Oligoflexia bacterium]|nr:J domain-containing protein [Oligoflexia bacterium]